MQVAHHDKELVRSEIRAAFASIVPPTAASDMLSEAYQTSEDACEMAAAFAGVDWRAIPVRELFYHREMLTALRPSAYCAYLPGYLDAAVTCDGDDPYGPDIREYLLSTLKMRAHQLAAVTQRLAALDPWQRASVEQVLRYLVWRWDSQDAASILADWADEEPDARTDRDSP